MAKRDSRLFFLKTDFLRDDNIFNSALNKINKSRREKAIKYKNKDAKIACVGASLILDHALKCFNVAADGIDFIYNEHGKPYLKNGKLFFNISHSKSAVICSVSESETGCDIEDISTPVFQIAKSYFCPNENNFLESIEDTEEKARTFYRLWTVKESILKAIGCGITIPLNSFCIDLNSNLIHVCSEKVKADLFYREYMISNDFCVSCASYKRESLPDEIEYVL